jgi:hypothetical protein
MKQETLEEAAEKETEIQGWGEYEGLSEQYAIKQAFINGAKWQAERMYSEAIKFGKWLDENIQQREYYPMSTMTMEELFKQFKKK